MLEFRLAQKGEVERQKEIWKLCFGDPAKYIDFFYSNRYKEDETALLVHNGKILAMLTMIPVKIVTPDKQSFNTVMLYAVATDPTEQNKGFATQLMNFSYQYLKENNKDVSILVPAEEYLFNFYRKRGYQNGFYIREILLTRDVINSLTTYNASNCKISSISAEAYNHRRNQLLSDKLYVAYEDKDIIYQKKLSILSEADIYSLDFEDVQGCVTIERFSPDRVFIKELLIPEEFLNQSIKFLAQQFSAKEFVVRTPAFLGEHLGGIIRPFAMLKIHGEIDLVLNPHELGYLGFAFD